jgi:ABC-type uncharacterized transport system substrate-binding protein
MRLRRRMFGLGIALMGVLPIASCSGPAKQAQAVPDTNFNDRPARAGYDSVLVVTPFAPSAHAIWSSMRDELRDDFDVVTLETEREISVDLLQKRIASVQPKCVVLMGNQSVRAYKALQDVAPTTPPAVVLMSSFAEQLVSDLREGTGIVYEVPAVTSFVVLRQLSERPVERVGVLYRPSLKGFVEQQAKLARIEKVELIGVQMDGHLGPRNIRLALRELIMAERVDALWVLNDNALLTASGIRDGWLPEARTSGIPILVGVSSLVNSQLSFGSLAVVPDHTALGVQAANLLFELSDDDWSVDEHRVELPLSVETVVDMTQSKVLRLTPSAEKHIDRTVSSTPSPLQF